MSEWKRQIVDGGYNADWKCKNCGHVVMTDFPPRYCPKCESDNRPKIHGCSFASEECAKNPCADCGLKEGEAE